MSAWATAPGNNRTGNAGLVCADCGTVFAVRETSLECSTCNQSWPVVDGIPHLVADFPYWGEIAEVRMQEINAKAQTGSWKSALLGTGDPAVNKAAEMILNLDRANWQWLIDLGPESRVLDIGAGTGTNSHAMAMRFRDVVATEPVGQRIEFMKHRFAQEKLTNVEIVRTSVWNLPFEPGTFDLAAMNGVLEWVATGRKENPRQLQVEALRGVCKLLRPRGYLYVGIENRLNMGHFIGYPDPHCGLPFVPLLPRRLADWYARRRGQDGYRQYLYSSWGYKKLLREAGFTTVEVYLALPSYNHPRFFIPVEGNMFSYYVRNFCPVPGSRSREIIRNVLLKLDILKYFEYSFAIIARK